MGQRIRCLEWDRESLRAAKANEKGASYVVGKAQLDKMIARASHQAEATGKPFNLQQTFAAIWASGIVPPSIIDSEFLERLR